MFLILYIYIYVLIYFLNNTYQHIAIVTWRNRRGFIRLSKPEHLATFIT
jgi:hypothetical protein